MTVVLVCTLLAQAIPQGPDPISILVDQVRSTPPEVQADLLIRIASRPKAGSRKARVAMLEEAFQVAAGAQEKWPLRQFNGGTDSLSGATRRAFARGIDTMSLQSRAVTALTDLDRDRAVELASSIVVSEVALRSCGDWFTYDFSHLYRMKSRLGVDVPLIATPRHFCGGRALCGVDQRIASGRAPGEGSQPCDVDPKCVIRLAWIAGIALRSGRGAAETRGDSPA
ncbi:hypothetical protein F183_A37850 [Bryobacterales bacterium F-183]|nr:hypothetical protein F183_A37850 [Bryobacterales bacterium F-183]